MNKNNLIILGAAALLALLISLPMEWMTITHARINMSGAPPGFAGMMNQALAGASLTVSGLNGHVTVGIKMPIWLIVVVGCIGVVLALLHVLGVARMPLWAPLVPLALSTVYVLIAIWVSVASAEATLGIGGIVALIGLGMGYAVAFQGQRVPVAMP